MFTNISNTETYVILIITIVTLFKKTDLVVLN